MDAAEGVAAVSRKAIAVRFLYTIFFVVVLAILNLVIQLCVLFQYVYLFITLGYSDPVRKFSNKVAVYAYRIMRYVALIENAKPFPFSDFPQETDPLEQEALFQ